MKNRRVSLGIPPQMHAALVRRAETNRVTVSEYIRTAIHEAMDRDIFAEIDAENELGGGDDHT